jgi:hypothetical protein
MAAACPSALQRPVIQVLEGWMNQALNGVCRWAVQAEAAPLPSRTAPTVIHVSMGRACPLRNADDSDLYEMFALVVHQRDPAVLELDSIK